MLHWVKTHVWINLLAVLTVCMTILVSTGGCSYNRSLVQGDNVPYREKLNDVAKQYVKLVLATGVHDSDYVDAYYGPAEWKTEASQKHLPLEQIKSQADQLKSSLDKIVCSSNDTHAMDRQKALQSQLSALVFRLEMLTGKRFAFDEESKGLYGAVAPHFSEEEFKQIQLKLQPLLPGSGSLADRYEQYLTNFVIPKSNLNSVFNAAIAEARKRSNVKIALPPNENFVLEFVTNKAWSAYNWYKGNAQSLIQINTDLPIYIDRAVTLAGHEGYPGHHVYNATLEQEFVKKRGWVEFSVYPLFSPLSLIAEGSADYGVQLSFPPESRIEFETTALYPLARIDPSKAKNYSQVLSLMKELRWAEIEAARRYLDGELNRQEAIDWLVNYALTPRNRAEQRLRFIDKYRSYVINYRFGEQLIQEYVERRAGKNSTPEKRWKIFQELLATPVPDLTK